MDPVTKYGRSEGRAYTTAMGALCFEVYYRYKSLASDMNLNFERQTFSFYIDVLPVILGLRTIHPIQ